MAGQNGEARAVEAIASASSWDARVALIRRVPEEFGRARRQDLYAAIAERVYVPNLNRDFAYVHWTDDYELAPFEEAYEAAHDRTAGFVNVDPSSLADAVLAAPISLRVFRVLLGLTTQEFAASTEVVAVGIEGADALSNSRIKAIEGGAAPNMVEAVCCAVVIDRAMANELFPEPPGEVRSKIDKPDTVLGWESVRMYAQSGVPLATFLHQRHYGGAFRQLLDATSTKRGDLLEDPVEELFEANGIPYIRTGSHNQGEIENRFAITVKPAPDFVVFDQADTLRAMLECKATNDGGTARDKAARFRALREEGARLGGVPVVAVLSGLGWKRTRDALGPVIRDTDGRTFTLPTLSEMLNVQPFPTLIGQVGS